jgi:carboxyl-terminal processing protease
MVAGRLTACVVVAMLVAGCWGGKREAADPLAPRVYLEHALALMRSNAVYTPKEGWSAVEAVATKRAASATTAAETYPALEYAIAQLAQAGDGHAAFMDPSESKQDEGFRASVQSPPPTVSLAAPRIGLIEVGGVLARMKTPGARRYAASALADISSLQRSRHPCGWIVDLRANGGGSMYPMLLGVGPILGSGRLIGFTDKKRVRDWVSYRSSTLFFSGGTDPAPARIPDFSPAPAVAVLTGPHTASSGEAVAIAFRGRPQTRSFGATTAGATTSPNRYRLADGATIEFAVVLDVDRRGHIYRRAVRPDVFASTLGGDDQAYRVAKRWLRSTTACKAHH